MITRAPCKLLVLLVVVVSCADARSKSPLLDEDAGRTRNKAAECVFGKQVRELGSQWVPDLGVPIGVLYCMKCECVPFRKKRRIVARVQCRSIKKECPVPTCEEPVLLPGRCCKTCPGDNSNPDVIQDVVPQNAIEEEERSTKHFAALLTGRSSLIMKNEDMQPVPNDQNKNNVVATGRFTFHKKNLYYSFYISDKAARPRSLQFVDSEGTILEEHTLSGAGGLVNSLYQNATRKVCGVWRRLPRDYRRLLKDERMFVVLVWGVKDQAEFTLSGQVMKYVALGTELFSSLLEPAPGTNSAIMSGAGGTAIVSASTTVSPSIHIAVVFNGIFLPDEISDVPVNITLALDEKKQIILEEKIRVTKPAHELNIIEVSSPVTPADLRLLTRGRLVLSVSSISKPESLRLSGNVITKATCELFQSTLNSPNNDRAVNPYGNTGLAWVYLNNEGSLVYNVQVEDLHPDQKPVFITLVDVTTTKRKMELEDLTPYFINGWANGTVDKLSPRVLEPLYSGNLAVNVETQSEKSLIRGRLSARLVADARDAPAPVLLKREDSSLPPSAVGMAWLSVDTECHLHYDVSVSGLGPSDKKLELYMELLPMIAPGAPVITRLLDEFHGNQVEGSPTETLSKEELLRLDTGVVFIKVKDKHTRNTLLSAILKEVKVPPPCLPHYTDNDVPTIILDTDVSQNGACFHDGKFFQEGDQWTTTDPCTMCYCQNGNARCDTSTCPEIECSTNYKIKGSGECCPVCSNSTSSQESNTSVPRGCSFGGKFYSAGNRFHPFLIPNGFDLCTECVCDPLLLEVKCTRQGNEKTCCKHCVESKAMLDSENGTYFNDPGSPNIIQPPSPHGAVSYKSSQQIMSEGGCKNPSNLNKPYENGQKFHPWIASLGEYKCVTCKCKNGNQSCERQRCTRAICHKMFRPKHNDVTHSTTEFCCSQQQCKRYRRHHRARDS